VKTEPRAKPENVKAKVVVERGYKHLRLAAEHVAEIKYRPVACDREYRLIISRKTIDVESGQTKLWQEYRYFFHITNDWETPVRDLVLSANQRCDQENLIEQLKNGVRALRNPLDNLYSNWAYMVCCTLAWTLKSWCGLLMPTAPGPHAQAHRQQKQSLLTMEFKTFANALVKLPCQIVRTGRRILYRLLSWNPWTGVLLRLSKSMRLPLRC